MAAIVRGGSRAAANPRPKASRASQGPRARGPSRGYAPAKIRAAQGVGLRPGLALGVAGGVVAMGLTVALLTGDRLHQASAAAGRAMAVQLGGMGFKVQAVHVLGASAQAKADILKATGLYKDEPILGVDLGDLRGRVSRVGWVKSVRVVRLLPDTMVISVGERTTAAVWQHMGRTLVVDDSGKVIPEADPGRFLELPLVVGEGANLAAADILPLVKARPRLMERLEALVRVDQRRWDVRLKDGGLIELPATGEESALIQLDQLDRTARILELGFARIDLRDPEMVSIRPREAPAAMAQPAAGGV